MTKWTYGKDRDGGDRDILEDGERVGSMLSGPAHRIVMAANSVEEREADMHLRIRRDYDKTVADSWREANDKLRAENEAFRVQFEADGRSWKKHVADLTKALDENERLRRTLVICANNVQAVVDGVLRHGDALSRIANVIAEAGPSEGDPR